jgi:hypothetical protein
MAVAGGALWALWWATWAQPNYFYPSIDNLFGIRGALGDVLEGLGSLGMLAVFFSCIAAVISVFERLQSAKGEERQQIKWFAYAAAVLVRDFFLVVLPAQEIAGPGAAFVFIMIGLLGIPVAVGVAIFKYPLYDIDVLINRTLVYGALTAILVGVYFGATVLLQRLFVVLSGEQSTFAVVGLHSRDRRPVQPLASAHPVLHRPQFLPA